MRITHGMAQRHLLADLQRSAERVSDTQRRLSSGKELTRPSDDPARVSQALLLRESLDGTRRHARNALDALTWQEASEQALARMTDVVHRARELIVAGASDTADAAARTAIAQEIDGLVESLKQQANTSVAGRHLFAGTATLTAPYGATDAYAGDAGSIAREIGPGVAVAINVRAEELLGNGQASGDGRLLHLLRDVRDHLLAGDGAALRTTDLARLDANLENLLSARAATGARANRLEAALVRLSELEETTLGSLSGVEDADLAATLVELSTQQAAYQAALRSGASIVQSSLLDFLR